MPYATPLQQPPPEIPRPSLQTSGRIGQQTLAIVLAGGRGKRLEPLTHDRAKPAVEFGASLRIIDFTLANCVNSGLRRVAVLTQYKAQSLLEHIQDAWVLPRRLGEFIDVVPAQQRDGDAWYRGTADAVVQNSGLIERLEPDQVFVLGGDHIYKMDYAALLAEHVASKADVSVACVEVPVEEAREFGVADVNERRWIVGWQEKPDRPRPVPGRPGVALVSMGIYLFDRAALVTALTADRTQNDSSHDFGHDVIPAMVRSGWRVHAHAFRNSCVGAPYWRDVGTLDAYWEANVEAAQGTGGLDMFDPSWPIAGAGVAAAALPTRIRCGSNREPAVVADSWIGRGCEIGGAQIHSSVVFDGARIGDGVRLEESLVLPGANIGAGTRLRRVIVDRDCGVPPGLSAGFNQVTDRQRFHVTEGGVTVISPTMFDAHAA